MPMKTWTVDEMRAERPCARYTEARIRELWADRERLSLLDILDLDIPTADRLWVCWRPTALTYTQRKEVTARIVMRAVTNHVVACGIPAVEAWARDWLSGKDRTKASADSAADAAWAAGTEAAWEAARVAGAASWAARVPAGGGGWVAAEAARVAAEENLQLADIRAVLNRPTPPVGVGQTR